MHQDESVCSNNTFYLINNIKIDLKSALWVALCFRIQEQKLPVVHASVCYLVPAPLADLHCSSFCLCSALDIML